MRDRTKAKGPTHPGFSVPPEPLQTEEVVAHGPLSVTRSKDPGTTTASEGRATESAHRKTALNQSVKHQAVFPERGQAATVQAVTLA